MPPPEAAPFRAERFPVAVAAAVIDDLRARIRNARLPEASPGRPWDQGTDRDWLARLLEYWADGFDWRAAERALNGFAHYRARVGGAEIHFVHERARRGTGIPLILGHGWPSCFAELLPLVPLLTDPAAHGIAGPAFDVVIPSLPGYGFSPRPAAGGVTYRYAAGLWHRLMHEKLNYRRPYGAQGGDWGAVVSSWLAFDNPVTEEKGEWKSGVAGLHLNMIGVRPGIDLKKANLSAAEQAWLGKMGTALDDKTAYQRIQSTRPQTLGVALSDSPVGLAAWIVEKFRDWSDCNGNPLNRFSLDLLLDNIMVYWLTGTAGSATWLYRGAAQQQPRALPEGRRVETPTAFAAFPADIAPAPPKEWIERAYDLRRHTVMSRGGHFAALEEPELLARDIREFFRPLRFGAAND